MEDRHDLADALESYLRILGLAVPDPPVQAVDFRDDHRPGVLLLWGVDRQGAGCLFGMVQPHGDVKPIERRRRFDAGIDQPGAQPGTAVGEGRQVSLVGVADGGEATLYQRFNSGVGPGNGGENLPGPVRCLDIAEANLQMARARLTAANEGRVDAQGDRGGGRCRFSRSGIPSPTLSVWARRVSGSVPASSGSSCWSTPAATR